MIAVASPNGSRPANRATLEVCHHEAEAVSQSRLEPLKARVVYGHAYDANQRSSCCCFGSDCVSYD